MMFKIMLKKHCVGFFMKTGEFRALYVPEGFNEIESGWCSLAQAIMMWMRRNKGLPVLCRSIVPIVRVQEGDGFDAIESIASQLERAVLDMEDILARYHQTMTRTECTLRDCPCTKSRV